MKTFRKTAAAAALGTSAFLSLAGGCCSWPDKTPTPPLGAQSDIVWRRQEAGASGSDFVIYQHEFAYDPDNQSRVRLNTAGEDHLKSIAARLHCGAPLPVVVERSMTSIRPDSVYQYPVSPNPELDMRRREAVVKSLVSLGIANADQCVLVALPLAEGYTATESAQAYSLGLTQPVVQNQISNGNANSLFGNLNALNNIGNTGAVGGVGVGGTGTSGLNGSTGLSGITITGITP